MLNIKTKYSSIPFCRIIVIIIIIINIDCQESQFPLKDSKIHPDNIFKHIDSDYHPTVELCIWKDNKKAALTFSFDDVRSSHYEVAAKELELRGFVCTFNLNTSYIANWDPWQTLFDKGHEIASHTYSHCNLTELPEAQIHYELLQSKMDIIVNIDGMKDVPSFVYPGGKYNDLTREIAELYYFSARGQPGINSYYIHDEDFSILKGVGFYPPYDLYSYNNLVDRTLRMNGWFIEIYHSISNENQITYENVPFSTFISHLDFVKSRADSLWIDTQFNIARYIKARQNSTLSCEVIDNDHISIYSACKPGEYLNDVLLSFILNTPTSWINDQIVIYTEKNIIVDTIDDASDDLLLEIPLNQEINLYAIKMK